MDGPHHVCCCWLPASGSELKGQRPKQMSSLDAGAVSVICDETPRKLFGFARSRLPEASSPRALHCYRWIYPKPAAC